MSKSPLYAFFDYLLDGMDKCLLEDGEAPLPQILYHYTDGRGLLGMLRGDVWLTSVDCLNDPTEGSYGHKCFVEHWNLISSPAIEPYHDKLRGNLVSEFVFCLSSDCDSLDQWRAYGSNGEGYCMGLRLNSAGASAARKMSYGDRFAYLSAAYVRDNATTLESKWRETGNNPSEFSIHAVIGIAAMYVSSSSKHSCYSSEREWRLNLTEPDMFGWMYRDGRLGITPYISRKSIDLFDVVSLKIGPRSKSSIAVVEALVSTLGKGDSIDVSLSDIPYR